MEARSGDLADQYLQDRALVGLKPWLHAGFLECPG